ncbi:MAG: M14 family metallocarboxypeptidase [Clostridia bacterium]|nr:M14 family metallocarboxypeptidase [Clostridia bacterium]
MSNIVESKNYTYFELKSAIYTFAENYPFVQIDSAGNSVLGKELLTLSVGKGKESVLICGAFHGSEALTATLILSFAERLFAALECDGEIAGIRARRALFDRKLVFLPMVNPDGCDISVTERANCGPFSERVKMLSHGDFAHWKANVRGVDINHNFDVGWHQLRQLEIKQGILGPAPTRYGGKRPVSEPETAALVSLCHRENFCHVAAFHSQGEEIYWNYGGNFIEKGRRMATLLSASSGYTLSQPSEIASHGGFKDWFIKEFDRPGFTIEVGKGENPLPITELDRIYPRVEELMLLLCIL